MQNEKTYLIVTQLLLFYSLFLLIDSRCKYQRNKVIHSIVFACIYLTILVHDSVIGIYTPTFIVVGLACLFNLVCVIYKRRILNAFSIIPMLVFQSVVCYILIGGAMWHHEFQDLDYRLEHFMEWGIHISLLWVIVIMLVDVARAMIIVEDKKV